MSISVRFNKFFVTARKQIFVHQPISNPTNVGAAARLVKQEARLGVFSDELLQLIRRCIRFLGLPRSV